MGRALAAVLAAGLLTLPAQAQATWRLEQPAPPPGSAFPVPLGAPGDLQFLQPSRGLLAVAGNQIVPQGLYVYNGERWRQYATVCGGSGASTRIAWASPDEFWTITYPSPPRGSPTVGAGLALCHFKGGQVVASYSTPEEGSPQSDGDPYRGMEAAACAGPSDCWFAGGHAQDPTGQRVGAFHLHWDGSALETVYAPSGRGVSDVEAHAGGFYESTYAGAGAGNVEPFDLSAGEPQPLLLGRIDAGVFARDPFVPAQAADGGSELLALDGDDAQLWAVGGGAVSGPGADPTNPSDRGPLAARLVDGGFEEVSLGGGFDVDDRFADVAAVPGTGTAWVAVQPFAQRFAPDALAQVALLGQQGVVSSEVLPQNGVGRGSAARIACPAADDCWMVTSAGWLFHLTDGSHPATDTEPAFQGTITLRPNEAAEQFVPDAPPEDDSQLFAPPPLEIIPPSQPKTNRRTKRLKPVLTRVRVRVRRGTTIVVSFRLRRRARIAVLALRRGRAVARTQRRLLRPGRHRLSLRLDPHAWPTRVTFSVVEPGQRQRAGGDEQDTVTTGPAQAGGAARRR
jgi:hypothetical protein